MRARLFAAAALLCALPARGANQSLGERVIAVLTPLDSVPVPAAIDQAFAPAPAVDHLISIALDASVDLGIQVRAIRALPAYCPAACANQPVHQALVGLVSTYTPAPDTQPSPGDTLRLIAAAEALGATHSGLAADFDQLWALLDLPKPGGSTTCAPGRDVRAVAARAIGELCFHDAIDAIRTYIDDPCSQVATQAGLAVQALEQCAR
jgi:hypothetical protein